MITVLFDPRVAKFLNNLSERDRSKVDEYVKLFKIFGFNLNEKYLKKVNARIWELRPGKIRLFLSQLSIGQVVIHAMYKKSQKITKETTQLINDRLKGYQ